MTRRARKEWNGGVRPELTPEGKAWIEHVEACAECNDGKWIFETCAEGKKLHEAAEKSIA